MLRQGNFYGQNSDLIWKRFVRESGDITEVQQKKKDYRLNFQGDEAKEAYERIVTREQLTLQSEKHGSNKTKTFVNRNNATTKLVPTKEKSKKQSTEEKVTINSILKAVEQKDLKFLFKHVTRENVNCTDDFGWTPLMSAAYCGHFDVIEFLLSLGANRKAREKSGLTAAQLALKRNYLNIVALLKRKTEGAINKVSLQTDKDEVTLQTRSELIETQVDRNGITHKSTDKRKGQSEENMGFYCEICNCNFYQTTWKKHETSTLHVFNTKPKLPSARYGISKQNKGYQMLLNTGWDEQGGLGPFGQGIKYPIKTYLKTDRKGLCQTNEKEYRVTHFKPGDTAAVNELKVSKQKCLKKRDREKLLNRDVRKERALRIALS